MEHEDEPIVLGSLASCAGAPRALLLSEQGEQMQALVNAGKNLESYVLQVADYMEGVVGFSYFPTTNAPNEFFELKKVFRNCERTGDRLPVYEGGAVQTIYPDKQSNYAFRFWHDCLHALHDKDFSKESEYFIGTIHCQFVAQRFGLNSLEFQLMFADTIGQTDQYWKDKAFVENQREFCEAYVFEQRHKEHPVFLALRRSLLLKG